MLVQNTAHGAIPSRSPSSAEPHAGTEACFQQSMTWEQKPQGAAGASTHGSADRDPPPLQPEPRDMCVSHRGLGLPGVAERQRKKLFKVLVLAVLGQDQRPWAHVCATRCCLGEREQSPETGVLREAAVVQGGAGITLMLINCLQGDS